MIKLIRKKYYIFLLFLFTVLYLLLGIINKCEDFNFHFSRIIYLSNNIKNNYFFAPLYFEQIYNYGYASPLFYGDIFLYPFAIMIIAGVPYYIVAKLAIITPILLSIISTYYCVDKIFKNEKSSFVACVVYCFSTYYFCNIFSRNALGEAYATAFLPLIVLGYYSIVYDDSKYWLYLPIGLVLCILSHILTSVIVVFFLLIASIVNYRKLFRDIKKIKMIFVSAVVFICLSAYFLFPLIEQLINIKFLSTSGLSSTAFGTLKERAAPLEQVLNPLVDANYNQKNDVWIPGGMGPLPLILPFLSIALIKRKDKNFYTLYISGIIILLISSKIFPWDYFQEIFGIIQFPWRLYSYAILFFALTSAYTIKENTKFSKTNLCIIFICTMISFVCYSGGFYKKMLVEDPRADVELKDSIKIGSGEYLPSVYDGSGNILRYSDLLESLESRNRVSSNNLEMENIELKEDFNHVLINYSENKYSNTYIDVPRIYYIGYRAIDLETNETLKISQGEYGTVRVFINNNKGSFYVAYGRTTAQKVSFIISLVTTVILVIYCKKRKVKLED